MVFVKYHLGGWLLTEAKFCASLVPKPVAVSLDKRRFNAVHHDDAIRSKHRQHLSHDFLQVATVTTDKHSVRKHLTQRDGLMPGAPNFVAFSWMMASHSGRISKASI